MAADDSSSSEVAPVVLTTHGKVRGTLLKTIYEESYYAFDGIPYAVPPLGTLRFKEPFDLKRWHGIQDCSKPRNKCLQVSSLTKQVEGSEDCLYLNISVKTFKSEKPLPLMVYVHGGGFKGGDASRRAWAPDYFMREEVIHISIGHRLGPFGFLSFNDPSVEVPGNAGLKDVVLALKWIKANAHNFNGDPNQITLFGHSSGSCMVHLLLMSPQSEGLFTKAILMAGFTSETNRLPHMEYRLAKHLGYEGEEIDSDVFDFIRKADPKLVASADFFTPDEKNQMGMPIPFLPTVEAYATPTSILLAEPIELQRNAWGNRIPIILGSNSGEGLVTALFKNEQQIRSRPEDALPRTLQLRGDSGLRRQLGQILLHYFCKNNELHLAALFTHNMFHSQQRVVLARLTYAQAPTYLYRFDFDSPDFNFYRIRFLGPEKRGVVHVDELGYIFVIPATFKLDKSRPEFTTICRMISMFTEFAKTSDPNSAVTKTIVDWKPVTRFGPRMLLNISKELKFMQQPEFENLKLYDRLYEQASVNLF